MVDDMSKAKYLTNFFVRAFLIAVFCLLALLGILLACYFIDLSINLKNGKTDKPLFGAYVIISPSMVPTIKVNDAIVIKRVDNDGYNIGDIITFSSSDINYKGYTITHRIINKVNDVGKSSIYTTKGDNNAVPDPSSVKTSAIYGKVILKLPKLGYIKSFFSKPINFFITILIPSIILLLYDGGRIFAILRSKKTN